MKKEIIITEEKKNKEQISIEVERFRLRMKELGFKEKWIKVYV